MLCQLASIALKAKRKLIWDPQAEFRVEPAMLHHRHKLTPYNGQRLSGVVETTFLRGEKIYDRGQFASSPAGRLLKRGAA